MVVQLGQRVRSQRHRRRRLRSRMRPIVESPSRHCRCEWSDLESTLGLAGRGGNRNPQGRPAGLATPITYRARGVVNVPELQGVGHIALTVTDPKRSADFYNRLFDAQTVLTIEDDIGPLTICVSPAMMFGFRTHPSTGEIDRFDPARVGLDHLGFHVADRQQLEAWRVRLDEQGVTNSGIIEDENGLHLNAKDPDNIALEFFYMPPQG
jgi:glyoxylase I family protein